MIAIKEPGFAIPETKYSEKTDSIENIMLILSFYQNTNHFLLFVLIRPFYDKAKKKILIFRYYQA